MSEPETETVCPECRSADTRYREKRDEWICEDCDHRWRPAAPEPGVEPPRSHRVFLSYGHDEHTPDVLALKADLEARGHEVWFDLERLKAGVDWEQYIEAGLNWCDRVILVMTPYSVRRRNPRDPTSRDGYCLNEIAKAIERNKLIIPVMLAWVEQGPPTSICRIQWLDMTDCVPVLERRPRYEARMARLVEALERDELDFEGGHARLLRNLKPLNFNAEMCQHIARFTGREWLFQRLDTWLHDPRGSRVFWIVAGPGYGKTAIATHLCHHRGDVIAYHLCVYGHSEKSDPSRAILSLAYQISTQLPEYARRLQSLPLEEAWAGTAQTLFDHLIVQPLSGDFPAPSGDRLVVIDALDEAAAGRRNELAELIRTHWKRTPPWLKLLVTSRPEAEILTRLQGLKPFLLDAAREENHRDVRRYLRAGLAEQGTQLDDAALDRLLERGGDNFLYASVILDEIQQGNLSPDDPDAFPAGLGGCYEQFFARQFGDRARYRAEIRPLLDAIITQRAPLPLPLLAQAGNLTDAELRERLLLLGSLVRIWDEQGDETDDEVIALFHRSVRDWLTDRDPLTHFPLAGEYAADRQRGVRALARVCWAEYEAGVEGMSPYAVRHTAYHLADAGRWEELGNLLGDTDYLDRLAGSAYRRWYLAEQPEWQRLLARWVEHLVRQRDSQAACFNVALVYFDAFFWWAEYLPFPLCEQVAEILEKACGQRSCSLGLRALVRFHRAYPPGRDYHGRGERRADWEEVREALLTLRAFLALEGELDLEVERRTLHLRGLLAIYLAEAEHALGNEEILPFLGEARRIFEGDEDDGWIVAWVLQQEAEYWLDHGHPRAALEACREGLRQADAADYEIHAVLYRLAGEAHWQQDPGGTAAWSAYLVSQFFTLWFQADPPPPDPYNLALDLEHRERLLARLREHAALDPAAARAAAERFRVFWSSIREEEPELPEAGEFPTVDGAILTRVLFPPAPVEGSGEYSRLAEEWVGRLREPAEALAHSVFGGETDGE